MRRTSTYFAAALVLAAVLALAGFAGVSDYAGAENWAWLPETADKEVDLFFVAPTVYGGGEDSFNMSMDDEKSRANFLGASNMERGIYEQSCNLYAPYYGQAALSVYKLPQSEREQYLALAYEDVREAFTYYMENYNKDRPVVLAGFSQGADMVLRLLKEFYGEDSYQDKLVAAYVIGGAVTEAELREYPHLKMAECASDLGCIVSFNSEAEDAASSVIVPQSTLGINPLNWKTDSTPAEASENLGACFTDYDGDITKELPELCGAYLDPVRGTLKVTGISPKDYPPGLDIFDEGNYHIYDYQFFFRNLQQNVALRVRQYLTLSFLDESYAGARAGELPKTTKPPYLSVTANVAPELLDAQYWIDNLEQPDQLVMTAEEIAAFNGLSQSEFYKYADQSAYGVISGEELRALLEKMGPPEGESYLDGKKTEPEYWERLVKLKNMEAIKESNELRYGVFVTRASMRVLPTDDVISTEPQFSFYDELQNSSAPYNEPVVVLHESADGDWLYVQTRYCPGWVHKEQIALCATFEQWRQAQDFKDFLVVTDDKLRTELDPVDEHCSQLELSMGARLELVPASLMEKSAEGRYGADCYVVKLPYRDDKGMYAFSYAYIPVSRGVHVGYLDYTPANTLRLAFNSDGCRYGWGGMYNARDCSQLVMELYRCFGLILERNSEDQAAMPCHTVWLEGMSDSMKSETLAQVPPGAVLHFPGHIMIYLGQAGERQYVLSSVGGMCLADRPGEVLTFQSVMVNDLSVTRRNGRTWLDSLCCAKVLWESAA